MEEVFTLWLKKSGVGYLPPYPDKNKKGKNASFTFIVKSVEAETS